MSALGLGRAFFQWASLMLTYQLMKERARIAARRVFMLWKRTFIAMRGNCGRRSGLPQPCGACFGVLSNAGLITPRMGAKDSVSSSSCRAAEVVSGVIPGRAGLVLGFFRMRATLRREGGRRFSWGLSFQSRQRGRERVFISERSVERRGDFRFKRGCGDERGVSFRSRRRGREGTFISTPPEGRRGRRARKGGGRCGGGVLQYTLDRNRERRPGVSDGGRRKGDFPEISAI